MRKLLLIAVIVIFNNYCFSQITSYSVQSFKDYDNGTRISYVKIVGIGDKDEADYITDEILKTPGISRFYIYEKEKNYNLCMIETNSSIEDEYVQSNINEIIVKFNDVEKQRLEIINEIPKFVDTGNPEYDNQVFKNSKDEWIKNNPEKYKILHSLNENQDIENPERIIKEQVQK